MSLNTCHHTRTIHSARARRTSRTDGGFAGAIAHPRTRSTFRSGRATTSRGPAGAQGGFTLIEVLIASLILLVGLLGVAGMQMLSLQANQGAYYRSQAVYIAAEILDAMRANPTAAADYVGIYPEDGGGNSTVPADPGCQDTAVGCTPAQAVAHDLHFWARHFVDAGGLAGDGFRPSIPNGTAQIIDNGGNEFAVQVSWFEEQFDDTDATDGSDTRSQVQQNVTLTSVLTP